MNFLQRLFGINTSTSVPAKPVQSVKTKSDISSDYQSVKIGSQEWMSRNLNVDKFRNGDPIPHAKTNKEWKLADVNKQPAWCHYDNEPAKGKKYGKLYNWYAVNDLRGLAPVGWHIPSDAEWTKLTHFLGGESNAGIRMKSASGWHQNGNGTNESRFSGIPNGYRSGDCSFRYLGNLGNWWSSTDLSSSHAWDRLIGYGHDAVIRNDSRKAFGYGVRCLRD